MGAVLGSTMQNGVRNRKAEDKQAPEDEPSEFDAHNLKQRSYTLLQRATRKLLGGLFFVLFFGFVFVSWVLRWLLCWTGGVFLRKIARNLAIRIPAWTNMMWSVKRLGAQTNPALPDKCIIVCNHQSFADSFTIECLLGIDVVYLVMEAVKSVPVFGALLDGIGCIFVGFKASENAADGFRCTDRGRALDQVKAAVKSGQRVCIFPEGWLSRDGKLRHFKDGAFEVARDTGAAILPVALAGGQMSWPPDEWPSFGTQYLKVGEPISTDGLELHEAKDSCKAAILKLRCEMFAELGWKVGSSVET